MFVDKMYIQNFRKYKNFEIEFNNRLSVIVGKNGSGKTTILDAVSYMISTSMDSYMFKQRKQISEQDLRLSYEILGSVDNFKKNYPAKINIVGSICGINYTVFQNRNEELIQEAAGPSVGIKLREKTDSDNAGTLLPVICSYGAGRLWNAEGINELTETTSMRENGYINALNAHLDSKSMNTWFEKMTYVELQNQEELVLLSAVRSAIENSFEIITGFFEVRVRSNLFAHELEISYIDNNKTPVKLLMSQLSDGYRCTACLIADIAYRMATLNPQLEDKVITETEGIVLIDEVDLHLHPEWQQKILKVLTEVFPKVQFIVTTHAPAVINSVRSESLIILEGDKAFSSPVESYGRDVNTIINTVMHADERLKSVKDLFSKFDKYLDEKRYEDAHKVIAELENILVTDDENLAACKVRLDFEEMLENEE